MTDGLSTLYQDLLGGSYDCVDRIVLNAYFRMGHDPGGFRVWWRALTGSDETLENAYLMRLAGRVSRRLRRYSKAHDLSLIDWPAGHRNDEGRKLLYDDLGGRRSGEDRRHLVRTPGYRATEPGLRALDLHVCVLRPRLRRAEAQRVPLSVLQLSDRIQSKPGLRAGRTDGPSVSGPH